MKIGQIYNTAATAAVTNNDRKAVDANRKGPAQASGTEADSSTQVELSATASALSDEGADPAFDAAKVERIAQAIRDGKFSVNHEAIADKLISNAQELLGRRLGGRREHEPHAAPGHAAEHPEAPEVIAEPAADAVDEQLRVRVGRPRDEGLERAEEVARRRAPESADVVRFE